MQLTKKPARRERESITPLIDMVFLLLIFFMLVGTIEPFEPFSVEPPAASQTDRERTGKLIIHIGKENQLAFEGQLMELATLTERIEARLAPPTAPQGQQSQAQQSPSPLSIALKADAEVDSARVIEILKALRDVGVHQVVLLTVPEES